jgi:hypothetical protein
MSTASMWWTEKAHTSFQDKYAYTCSRPTRSDLSNMLSNDIKSRSSFMIWIRMLKLYKEIDTTPTLVRGVFSRGISASRYGRWSITLGPLCLTGGRQVSPTSDCHSRPAKNATGLVENLGQAVGVVCLLR